MERRRFVSLPLAYAGSAWAATGRPKLALNTGTSPRLLKLARQLGLEWADLGGRPLGLIPPPGQPPKGEAKAFSFEYLRDMKSQVEAHGLKVCILPLHPIPNALLGNVDRDRDIDAVHQSIRAAARAGIPVLEYNWMLLRPSAGYFETDGRAGSRLRGFDFDRIKNDTPLAEFAGVTVAEIWKRLEYFLKAVVPIAEKEGVRLALHPNDPPVEAYRGVRQAIRTGEDLKRVVGIVDSPSNGITFDTGVMREGGGDVIALIRYFGSRDRINHVHFRNVRVQVPFNRYIETFVEDGDIDMKAAMRAFVEAGYSRCLVPDHSPRFDNDSEDHLAGWAYTIGYLKALLG